MNLYKKDTKNKIRILTMWTKGDSFFQETGLLEGEKILNERKCHPKNTGKANATTGEEQAIKELESKMVRKLKEGYFLTLNEAISSNVILPMLAKEFNKESHKIDWNTAYVQPKLDGMRCLDTITGKISRKNTPIITMDHIKINRPSFTNFCVDGELYAHGLTFQENMKLIKKVRPDSVNIKYHIYDVVSDLPFIDRYALVKTIVDLSDNVELVPTFKVNSLKDIKTFHTQFLKEGYEGTMIRWGNEGYKINGRSSNLLKYKDFKDIRATLVDVIPSDKRPTQGVPVLEWKGKQFSAGCKLTHKERENLLINKNQYIGQTAEIRYFEETDDGLPRFPVLVGFRQD